MDIKRKKGRKPKPKRTVVNIVNRVDGKRQHFHSFTLNVDAIDVMRLLQEAYPDKITH